jgi:exosortase
VFLLVFSVAFHSTILSLYSRWIRFDEAYGHGLMVLAIVIYLLYELRDELRNIESEAYHYAAIPLIVFSIVWGIAYFIDIIIIQQLLLPVILLSVITLTGGIRYLKILLFPVGFIYFAIPVWDYIIDFLLELTVHVVSLLVQLTRLTAFIEGDTIKIPSGDIVVAHGCAGLRYLIISSSLSFLSSYLFVDKLKYKILITALGIFLGLFTNWIRVYSLIVIGYVTEMQSSLLTNHETFGWFLFIVVFCPVLVIIHLMKNGNYSV